MFLWLFFGRWASCVACTTGGLYRLLYLFRKLLHSIGALRRRLKEYIIVLFRNLLLGNVWLLLFDLLHEELEVVLQSFLHVF